VGKRRRGLFEGKEASLDGERNDHAKLQRPLCKKKELSEEKKSGDSEGGGPAFTVLTSTPKVPWGEKKSMATRRGVQNPEPFSALPKGRKKYVYS